MPKSDNNIALVGSSAVDVGIHHPLLQYIWLQNKSPINSKNFGMTGLLAYELLFLKDYLLDNNFKFIIYGYNQFSFTNTINPQTLPIRWNTTEYLHMTKMNEYKRSDWENVGLGFLADSFFGIRYRVFLSDFINGLVHASIAKIPEKNEYSMNPEMVDFECENIFVNKKFNESVNLKDFLRPYYQGLAVDSSPLASPLPETNGDYWMKTGYIESLKADSLGYKALDRFLNLAEKKNVKVILLALPEPDFSLNDAYRTGSNANQVDINVKAIATKYNVPILNRLDVKTLEEYGTLFFHDRLHLGAKGRCAYSAYLAITLEKYL
ncbi:MAG: SGNH/GDSL hydrolase family protein [Bacteriovoracaceae bacterium]